MIYFICALYCEAKPVIDFYGLKRNSNARAFQEYESEDVRLVISGLGKVNSAASVGYIVSMDQPSKDDLAVNIGICGSKSRKKGQGVLINKITDRDSQRNFYPDILIRSNFDEGSLETFSQPAVNQEIEDVCDMEGSGFFEACQKFLPSHSIQVVKVVSDNLEGIKIPVVFADKIIRENFNDINKYIEELKNAICKDRFVTGEDIRLIQKVAENLRLTESQRIQLRRAYLEYKLRVGEPGRIADEFVNKKVSIKNESKREFSRLLERLSE